MSLHASPNKLFKKRPLQSHTLSLALKDDSNTLTSRSSSAQLQSRAQAVHGSVVPTPTNGSYRAEAPSEQYWAARALHAETLLAAHEKHQRDMKTSSLESDTKRQKELDALRREHAEKHASVERLVYILLAIVLLLVIVIIYLTTHYTRHSLLMQKQKQWWSAIGASHFTIPILSPFTSVVEHETSVIGSRLVVSFAVIFAALGYFIFRFWLGHRPPPTTIRHIDR